MLRVASMMGVRLTLLWQPSTVHCTWRINFCLCLSRNAFIKTYLSNTHFGLCSLQKNPAGVVDGKDGPEGKPATVSRRRTDSVYVMNTE